MSKSLGNTLDPMQVINAYGLDQTRYFLMREVPFGNDGDFSESALRMRLTSELSNDLGNLSQRVLSFVHKHAGAAIPANESMNDEDRALLTQSEKLLDEMQAQMDQQLIHQYIQTLWGLIGEANRYVDAQKPWDLRKTDTNRMNAVLYVLMELLRHIGLYVQPLMPDTGAQLLDMLGVPAGARSFADRLQAAAPGTELHTPVTQLFPRLEGDDHVLS